MKNISIIGSIIGVVFTVMAVYSLKPTSLYAFIIFTAWSCLPFVVTTILSVKHNNIVGVLVAVYLSLFIGVLLFLDIKYWHPDPQGGIAVLILPVVYFVVIFSAVTFINVKKE